MITRNKESLAHNGNSWMRIIILFLVLGFGVMHGSAQQQDSSGTQVELSGFADTYYAFDPAMPTSGNRQPFFYNHNRNNEFNLNLGYLKAAVTHPRFRANLALQAGTYVNANYANEPGTLKNIFEGNVGLSLNRKNSLWLDAGIFASHIGFESAVSMDNWTLTRSILAENSPYFLAGAKLAFRPNPKWEMTGLVLNGWQRIQRVPGSSLPSFGTQAKVTPSEKVTLNWSTFVGTEDPDSTRRMRYFNNFFGQFQVARRFGLIAGFDFGFQQRSKGSTQHDLWYSLALIGRYAFSDKWAAALRAEYYQDASGVVIPSPSIWGFSVTGTSLNLDYSPWDLVKVRVEGRWMLAEAAIFQTNEGLTRNNFAIVASLAARFGKVL